MADVNMKAAKVVYNTITEMLDADGWKYKQHEDDLVISCGVRGEDLPIDFLMVVRPKQELVQFVSQLPFKVPEDKRVEMAIAICVANMGLVNGCFEMDVHDGTVSFKLSTSYCDSLIGKGALKYMVLVGASTVDEYNDKFFMLCKNVTTLEQFVEQESAD